jgi:hypothetical protein
MWHRAVIALRIENSLILAKTLNLTWNVQVLGIIGALDPHTHKVNQADLQGEGKLEREGVRPQRQQHSPGVLPGETLGAAPSGAAVSYCCPVPCEG